MRQFRYWLKDAAFGALIMLERDHRRGVRAVLMYHSVGSDVPGAVSSGAFRLQLAYLKANFRVLPLRDFVTEVTAESTGAADNLAAITFDDGALDNYEHALPALEDFGLKATFFLITGCIGGIYRGTYFQTPTMNQRHVQELASLGHEVGAHTITHPKLTSLPHREILHEMTGSKCYIEDLTGQSVASFAYPFGDANEDVRASSREAMFKCSACTCEALVSPGDVDWHMLPRVGIDNTMGMVQFRGKVSPALELYEKLHGRRMLATRPSLL